MQFGLSQKVSSNSAINIACLRAYLYVFLGSWKYGIWGLCPGERLHQLHECLIMYALDDVIQNLFTDASRDKLEKDVAKIIKCC